IYFFFISCSTIGLGDVTPAHPEYMIATFGVVMVGLSLVSVCIDVVKEKLELMYMALLKKMLQDYMEAVKNGDPNAAAGMMAGFQEKAKFLMPLISKGQGARVMSRFREDCSAKGIEPPAVLVDLDPNTGMPAFANAAKEDFKEFIENAVERRADEEKKELMRYTQLLEKSEARLPVGSLHSSPLIPKKVPQSVDSYCQTLTPLQDTNSFAAQVAPVTCIVEVQTTLPKRSEAAVQHASLCSDDASTQCDLFKPEMTSTAVQPDVSQITVLDEKDVEVLLSKSNRSGSPEINDKESASALESSPMDLRFMRSVGEQTDEGDTNQETPQVYEVGVQSNEVRQMDRHCQTKLSSITTREIMAINEVKRRARHPTLRFQQRSIRSSQLSSTSDGKPAAAPGDHRLSGRPTSSGQIHSEDSNDVVAEVSVDVSFVNKPVDEHGNEVIDIVDVNEHEDEDDVFLSDSDENIVESFLVEECTQTDSGANNKDVQCSLIVEECSKGTCTVDTQTGLHFSDGCAQTNQPLMCNGEVQTIKEGPDIHENVQTQTECFQTFSDGSAQTNQPLLCNGEVQTIEEGPDIHENVQTQTECLQTSSDTSTQTSDTLKCCGQVQDSSSQTDVRTMRNGEVQTVEKSHEVMRSVGTETDDELAIQGQPAQRISVDNSTYMEPETCKTSYSQTSSLAMDSVYVQCTPAVSTSQTQYTCTCVTDESSQTEICMKNKRNQECGASVETEDACTQSVIVYTDKALQTASMVDMNPLGSIDDAYSGVQLWSDFDRVPIKEFDVSQQTSPTLVQDVASYFNLEVHSLAIQTKPETKERECYAKVEMGEDEVQAVVESLEAAVGQADNENWIKVYLAELDDEKRRRMMDIGIQTGVLARVQHIYATVDTENPVPDVSRPSIRVSEAEKVDVDHAGESSIPQTQLPSTSASVPQSPVDQVTTTAQLFRNKSPTTFKKPQLPADVYNRVSDLRSRFERSKPDRRRTRSSSNER
uniref:Ion_trans_2 domain-containing protein n=1 Tax=Haemonchus contortus TaxID=6289 RepID=A0A7I4YXF1_HAECO